MAASAGAEQAFLVIELDAYGRGARLFSDDLADIGDAGGEALAGIDLGADLGALIGVDVRQIFFKQIQLDPQLA